MTGPKSPERGASPLSGEKFETVPKLKGTGEEEEKELRGAPTDRPTDPTAKRIFHRPPPGWSFRN